MLQDVQEKNTKAGIFKQTVYGSSGHCSFMNKPIDPVDRMAHTKDIDKIIGCNNLTFPTYRERSGAAQLTVLIIEFSDE